MRTVAAVFAVLAFSCVVGCGDDDGGGANAETVTQLVGPAGGTVELSGGGKVTIPANALTAEVSIKITKLELGDVADVPNNLEAAGKPYAFEPHGTNFARAVKIEVPYEGDEADVRPIKLDDEDDTTWQTLVGSEKDDAAKKLSIDVTSFSVILAARPRRNSGIITLPDGAINDGSSAGEGGSGGTSGSGGSAGDAMDAGAEDAGGAGGTSGVGGTGGTDAGMACFESPTRIIPALTSVDDVVHTGGGVLVAADGKVTRYIDPYDNPVDLILPSVGNNERFANIDANGGRVIATAGPNGQSTRIACADATVNGTGSTTYFDLQTYSMYQVALNLGQAAYVPKSGYAVTDGFIAVVQEMTYGGIVVIDPTNCTPLDFDIGTDPSNGPLTGAVGLELIQGSILVAAIEKNSDPAFRGVRTFLVNDGVSLFDEEAVTAGRIDAINHAPSTLGTTYLLSIFPNPEFQLIAAYVNSGTGEISVDSVPFVTGSGGRQVRDVASIGSFAVASTPLFGQTPAPGLEVFVTGEGNVAESAGQTALPTGFYGDRISAYPDSNIVYIAGPGLLVLDLQPCFGP